MGRYRKLPVEIEAVQMPAAPGYVDSFVSAPPWLIEAMATGVVQEADDECWRVKTLEGAMTCRPGDWIIRGIKGELYPCKLDIFAATYEAVQP